MVRLFGRVRRVRIFDLLIVSLVGANVFYVLYNWSNGKSLDLTTEGDLDEVTASSRSETRSQLRGVQRDIVTAGHFDIQVTATAKATSTERARLTPTDPCPDQPPNLIGSLACICGKVTAEFLTSKYENMELGGRLRPPNCKPPQRLAVIIPYRDRYDHLHTLLNMIIPILTRQQADVTFFVIEQTNSTYFNRAALQNIGFLEAVKIADFDCFVFHDVDLVPLNDFHLYRCGPSPIHFTTKIQSSHWTARKEMYKEYTGGVVAMTQQQYRTINGNSNLYFGWGGEDDDLYERIINKNMKRLRGNKAWALYQMLHHVRQEVKGENPQRFEVLKTARKRQDVEGLNTCKYKVNEMRKERLYTWINVSLNTTEILQTAPSYTLEGIMRVLRNVTTGPSDGMDHIIGVVNATLENNNASSSGSPSAVIVTSREG